MEYTRIRDLAGYGKAPPHARWPGDARLAFNVVINFEEGAEHSPLDGDETAESYLCEIVSLRPAPRGRRLYASESNYEYGSRVGIWRLVHLLQERQMTATVWAVGQAVERNPEPIKEMAKSGFEIASHHYRWIDYTDVPENVERDHIKKTIDAIVDVTGDRPVGFFHWSCPNSRRLIVEEGGFLYDSEESNDDLPYWIEVCGRPHLILPYTYDNNDFRYSNLPGWGTGKDFLDYNVATFDQLMEEGRLAPKMLTLPLHARISGRPGRAREL